MVLNADTDIKVRFSNNLAHSTSGNSILLAICVLRRDSGSESTISPDGWISDLVARRALPLDEAEESARVAARDMLRHGKFKPTGRSKPASEYLLNYVRREGDMPRVSDVVDVANAFSLEYVVPVSVWDLDRAPAAAYVFRLGGEDEAYVFNATGQSINLSGLVCGCAVTDAGAGGTPCVNPVKDSMATKTTELSELVGFVMYAPGGVMDRERLEEAMRRAGEVYAKYTAFSVIGALVLAPGESDSISMLRPNQSPA